MRETVLSFDKLPPKRQASARLKTGDWVRVDGTAGAVELLEAG